MIGHFNPIPSKQGLLTSDAGQKFLYLLTGHLWKWKGLKLWMSYDQIRTMYRYLKVWRGSPAGAVHPVDGCLADLSGLHQCVVHVRLPTRTLRVLRHACQPVGCTYSVTGAAEGASPARCDPASYNVTQQRLAPPTKIFHVSYNRKPNAGYIFMGAGCVS